MWYVYILRSTIDRKLYIGSTNDLNRRLKEHNMNKSRSMQGRGMMKLLAYIAVSNEQHARSLEKYFKTGSGKAILKKRILPDETR